MKLTTKNCPQCKEEFAGRVDKKFCSIDCKNSYNYALRKKTKKATASIDKILHRNHEILTMLMPEKRKKIKYDRLVLEQAGFNFNYFTGTYKNSKSKLYHYVYNYAWMEFSTQEILIIKQ